MISLALRSGWALNFRVWSDFYVVTTWNFQVFSRTTFKVSSRILFQLWAFYGYCRLTVMIVSDNSSLSRIRTVQVWHQQFKTQSWLKILESKLLLTVCNRWHPLFGWSASRLAHQARVHTEGFSAKNPHVLSSCPPSCSPSHFHCFLAASPVAIHLHWSFGSHDGQ